MKIRKLRWNEWNIEHIQKHGVSVEEVEDICYSKHFAVKSGKSKMALWGQTVDGSYLLIILVIEEYGDFYPISARQMEEKEKRNYKKWTKR